MRKGLGTPHASDEQVSDGAIGVVHAWLDAIRRRDLERLVALHSDDVALFDVAPDVALRGRAAYARAWAYFLDALGPAGTFALHDLHVRAGGSVGYAHALVACNPGGGPMPSRPNVRLTLALERRDGRWVVAHEHHSVPYEGLA